MPELIRVGGGLAALLFAYNRKDPATQVAVERASSICEGIAITPNARYRESLKANP